MSEIKDESVAREDWTTAQQALRDEKLLKGAVAGEKKEHMTVNGRSRHLGCRGIWKCGSRPCLILFCQKPHTAALIVGLTNAIRDLRHEPTSNGK